MMRLKYVLLVCSFIGFVGCSDNGLSNVKTIPLKEKLESHYTTDSIDSLEVASYYVPVYSEIYSANEHMRIPLTVTLSVRNTSLTDAVYVKTIKYFDTSGKEIRAYLDKPIRIKPMETFEIVVEEKDKSGGTGANFLIESIEGNAKPLIQAVMIGTLNQQGISYLTEAKELNN